MCAFLAGSQLKTNRNIYGLCNKYPAFKVFSWELWGYGFDGKYYDVDEKELEEQLRLIDLLLSTQYWH